MLLDLLILPLALVGLIGLALVGDAGAPLESAAAACLDSRRRLAHRRRPTPGTRTVSGARRNLARLSGSIRPGPGGYSRFVLLGHGSAGASAQMNAIAGALTEAGFTAVGSLFSRHAPFCNRGDVAYAGQLDDDLEDLITALRDNEPQGEIRFRRAFLGRRLRTSGGRGAACRRPVRALCPSRPPTSATALPTVRPTEAAKSWAVADVPRIVAILILGRFGIAWPEALPVLAFATGPGAKKSMTDQYTFRLMASYAAPDDWEGRFRACEGADRRDRRPRRRAHGRASLRARSRAHRRQVALIPGVDHMGLCWRPAAIKAVVAALNA